MTATATACRGCDQPLTEENARTYQGPHDRTPRWVGACRKCETAERTERKRRSRRRGW